jgi:hypothetical protein
MKITMIFSGIVTFICIALLITRWPILKEECDMRINSDRTWQAVGWDMTQGHPDDCVMPYWGIFHNDGTWEPTAP